LYNGIQHPISDITE